MQRFRFSLQAVKTIREKEEEKALEAFAQAQAMMQRIVRQQQAIQREIDSGWELWRGTVRKGVSAEDIQQLQQGIRVLREALRRCEEELQKALATLEQTKRLLLEARQKREMMDKLYAKQRASHDTAILRAEQKVLDDFATMRPADNLALRWK